MIREYRTIEEVAGPLMLVKQVEGVKYDELGEIELPDGEVRRCRVLEVNGRNVLVQLFEYFEEYPEKLPIDYLETISKESVGRAVCDYISGMTDRYALDLYHEIFIPEVWRVK